MELKKLKTAKKKMDGAISVFNKAINEMEDANELLLQSRNEDLLAVTRYEKQILSLTAAIDEVQASALSKDTSIKENMEVIKKLKDFTLWKKSY